MHRVSHRCSNLCHNSFCDNELVERLRDGDPNLSTHLPMEWFVLTPWREWGDVTEVARGAVVLASEDANFITGIAMPIDGGYTCQ